MIALLLDREFNHSRKCLEVPIREKLDSRNIMAYVVFDTSMKYEAPKPVFIQSDNFHSKSRTVINFLPTFLEVRDFTSSSMVWGP